MTIIKRSVGCSHIFIQVLVGRGLQGVDETLLLFQESNSLGLSAF